MQIAQIISSKMSGNVENKIRKIKTVIRELDKIINFMGTRYWDPILHFVQLLCITLYIISFVSPSGPFAAYS